MVGSARDAPCVRMPLTSPDVLEQETLVVEVKHRMGRIKDLRCLAMCTALQSDKP